jgi:hypothetical protein
MCVTVQKKYVPLILLTAYRAAGIRVIKVKDNIEMDIKEMPLMTRGLNRFNTQSKVHSYQSRYLTENN